VNYGRISGSCRNGYTPDDIRGLADHLYNPRDIGAAVSSGSFVTAGMLAARCSIKTLSGIAHCYNENLVVRAADVC
jgi:flavin prenyltransferase